MGATIELTEGVIVDRYLLPEDKRTMSKTLFSTADLLRWYRDMQVTRELVLSDEGFANFMLLLERAADELDAAHAEDA